MPDAAPPFDLQPTLKGKLVELRPLRPTDFDALYAIASDPGIWEQHPAKERAQPDGFRKFFQEALDSGGALIAHDTRDGKVISSLILTDARSPSVPRATSANASIGR